MALDVLFDGVEGIAGAGYFAGEGGVQHGEVVEVVASSEDVLGAEV